MRLIPARIETLRLQFDWSEVTASLCQRPSLQGVRPFPQVVESGKSGDIQTPSLEIRRAEALLHALRADRPLNL